MVYFGSKRFLARQMERAFMFKDVAEGSLDVNAEDRVAANLIFKKYSCMLKSKNKSHIPTDPKVEPLLFEWQPTHSIFVISLE